MAWYKCVIFILCTCQLDSMVASVLFIRFFAHALTSLVLLVLCKNVYLLYWAVFKSAM